MSYYHYFTLKEDSYYGKMTIEEIESKLKRDTSSNFYYRSAKHILKAKMVRWYYTTDDKLEDRRMEILNYLLGIETKVTKNLELEWALEAKKDEDGLVRNRPASEYDMQEQVDNWYDFLEETIGKLLILSCIRFEADEKYSDTSKTVSDYLTYDYQNRIDEILEYFEEECFDYEFAKFVINNCNRQTEDEKYGDIDS